MPVRSEHDGEPHRVVGGLVDVAAYLGPVLHEFRIHREMTQSDVADCLSDVLSTAIGQGYVCRVEANDITVSMERFLGFCQVLRVKPEKVFKEARRLAKMDEAAKKGGRGRRKLVKQE